MLSPVVSKALAAATDYAGRSAAPFDPEEEHLRRGFLVEGFPALASGIGAKLSAAGLDASFAGVLCHGKPLAKQLEGPCAGRTCEIGDLLFVVHREFPGGGSRNVALLVQLKMAGMLSAEQEQLYAAWPRFRYAFGERKVTAPVPHAGAVFATARIVGGPWLPPLWTSIDGPGRGFGTLEGVLSQLMAATGGREFVPRQELAPSGRESDWDGVIWDLLDDTARHLYHGVERGYGVEAFGDGAAPPSLLDYVCDGGRLADQWEEIVGRTHERGERGENEPVGARGFEDGPAGVSAVVIDITPQGQRERA
jgi:hypothetical protein